MRRPNQSTPAPNRCPAGQSNGLSGSCALITTEASSRRRSLEQLIMMSKLQMSQEQPAALPFQLYSVSQPSLVNHAILISLRACLKNRWHGLPARPAGLPAQRNGRRHPLLDQRLLKQRRTLPFAGLVARPVRLGARGVSPAVFGVPPKTFSRRSDSPLGWPLIHRAPVGETPTGATGTVTLPISTTSFRLSDATANGLGS